jgi:hypothetical protein
MFELRDYQQIAVKNGIEILKANGILILNFEVRTGKTHIALAISSNYQNTLFVTKKKAISSIESDYQTAEHCNKLTVINYEQLSKYKAEYDLVIFDESHGLGAFPKPNKKIKEAANVCLNGCDVILMSGTLMPESNAQIFHQLWVSSCSPFKDFKNFYRWFESFGKPKLKYTSYGTCNDYSDVSYDKIRPYIEPIILTKTQGEAGFVSEIVEQVCTVIMQPSTYNVIAKLKNDKVVEGKNGVVLADTAVKEMQKLHQLYSGTIKFEDGSRFVFDETKSKFIAQKFKNQKIAIFYKFIAELEAIKRHIDVTDNIHEFNTTDKSIALQIVSGREGINLSAASAIVYYNIDFSAVSYWQSRDRMTTKDRVKSNIYWIFSHKGIEHQIYKAVMNKKDFTLQTFKKWHQNTNLGL